jgi:hypothetical protein
MDSYVSVSDAFASCSNRVRESDQFARWLALQSDKMLEAVGC